MRANEKYRKVEQWYTNEKYSISIKAGEFYTLTRDTDLYATEQFTNNFVTGEGVPPLSEPKVIYPRTVTSLVTLVKNGYVLWVGIEMQNVPKRMILLVL